MEIIGPMKGFDTLGAVFGGVASAYICDIRGVTLI